ncbi:NADPH-dependent FMN reductase [Stutzerimonas nitrititolerans]|uniref:NADPH-dependent FMN reductase n=1 Tax=Stutzerimonas nitrititolerans TaxID=2482751 RepID=UPI00289E8080|nr:NAD(P)H-dependent oxidoreductase [Stutzerimonas nitrititolerans]
MKTIHLLGLCGSLRKASSNAVILRTLATELVPARIHLRLHSLHDLPLYNGDVDGGDVPAAVLALRDAVEHAEGVILGTPEYSHGMSGVMKNALDWLSGPNFKSPLKGKPTITFTATPAFTGGTRAQQQLHETLWAMQAELVAYPQIIIADVDAKICDGRLWDESARQFLANGVSALEERVRDAAPATLTWA